MKLDRVIVPIGAVLLAASLAGIWYPLALPRVLDSSAAAVVLAERAAFFTPAFAVTAWIGATLLLAGAMIWKYRRQRLGTGFLFTWQELVLVGVVLVVLVVTTALDSNRNYLFQPKTSAVDVARQTAMLGIFALGAAVVIISGGIDLSAGSMIAFSGTTCATLMLLLAPEEMKYSRPLGLAVITVAIAGTLVVGLLVGTLHAWLITVVRLPPFIATLATLVGLRSLGRAMCENATLVQLGGKSTQIQIYDEQFRYLATSVWIPVVLFLAVALVIWFVLGFTVVGRHLYALGGNEQAARLSGIRTHNVKWLAYCIGSLTATLAGILFIADQSVADPQTLGRGYELNGIAAAVVGGVSLQGGIGTVAGTVLGALFLRVVIDGVAKVVKTGADVFEGMIVGVVVVLAVAAGQFWEHIRSGREALPGTLGIVSIFSLSLLVGVLAMQAAGVVGGCIVAALAFVLLTALKIFEVVTRSGK
jgi:ribose/xylose/arabinose/galactoside ABC-type transport system permease subunit